MTRSVKFANLVLAGGTIISIALLLYAFSLSFSRGPQSTYKYYLISITLIAFFLGVLYRCTDEAKVNIALFFLSIGTMLYIIELVLVFYWPLLKHRIIDTETINHLDLPVDSRNKFQITMDLRKRGINAYPHIFPFRKIDSDGMDYNGNKVYPLGAIANSTTVFCNGGSGPVIYETDEHGFRNPKGQYVIDSLDLALVGDSFAQGHCVKNGNDIAGQLRKSGKKVLNLGMEASGPLIELGIFSEYALPFKPKHVFWLYYEGNDPENLLHEKQSSTLMKYLEKGFSQNLVYNQNLADNALISDFQNETAKKEIEDRENNAEIEKPGSVISNKKLMIQIMKFSVLRLKLGLHGNCSYIPAPILKDILKEAKSRVEGWGGKLYFVYLPENHRYKKNMCRKRYVHTQNNKILSLLKELNINVIDMSVHFASHGDPLSLFEGHYNSKGYALVAQKIEERLE